MAIKIISDSTAYINGETQRELDIRIIPLSVHFKDESFKETEVDYDYFYNKIESTGCIPTSSQPSLGEIHENFRQIVARGDEILGIFISSTMSGTWATALKAKEMILHEFPDAQIEIMDSYTNCMAMGLQVLAAARLAQAGESFKTVLEAAQNTRDRVRFYFVPETLEYLRKRWAHRHCLCFIGIFIKYPSHFNSRYEKGYDAFVGESSWYFQGYQAYARLDRRRSSKIRFKRNYCSPYKRTRKSSPAHTSLDRTLFSTS